MTAKSALDISSGSDFQEKFIDGTRRRCNRIQRWPPWLVHDVDVAHLEDDRTSINVHLHGALRDRDGPV